MSEGYWERKQRHLNEDHKFRIEQSKRDVKILRGRIKIDRPRGEIARRERSKKLKSLLDDMKKQRTSILEQISRSSTVGKHKWYERLSGIDLTHPGADTELKTLLEEVERERRLWSFDVAEWWNGLPGMDIGLSNESAAAQEQRSRLSLNPVELKFKQRARQREIERELLESSLGVIASSLGVLISTRTLYESTRSQL